MTAAIEAFSLRGLEVGLPAFQLPMFRCLQNVMHCRNKICCTSLFQESIPAFIFWNSKHPLPTRTRSLSFLRAAVRSISPALNGGIMPIPSLQLQKNIVLCREAEWSLSCGLQDFLQCSDCAVSAWCYVTVANQRTIVEIELLATVSWKWGCRPFSSRCSQNVMH